MKHTIIFSALSLIFFSCGNNREEKAVAPTDTKSENSIQLTAEQYKNAGIEIAKFSTLNISPVLKLNGKIDVPPQSMVSISVPYGGFLKSTTLIPGMRVKKGDVLAVLEDVQFIQLQEDYLTAKAKYTLYESEYKRQKELNQSKASSDKLFEQAKANYELQMVVIKSLEEKLKLIGLQPGNLTAQNISKSIRIYSPINGFVSAVNVNVGKYVNSSDILFDLVNPTDIHLKLTVFEKDIHKLAIGQKLVAYTNTNPEKKYPLQIILISKNVSSQNATEVHCHFEQYDKALLPGMFMNAQVELTAHDAIALPEDAIVRYENKHFVFISKDSAHFEMIAAETGNSENGYTEILNAAEMGDENFVIKGAYTLLMTLKNESKE